MTPLDAIRAVRGYAGANRLRFSRHALRELFECGSSPSEVRNVLAGATRCDPQGGERWEVSGPDFEGEPLTVIVVIDDGLVVVTVFGPR